MKKTICKWTGLFLCLAMLLSVLPLGAAAADTVRVYCQAPEDWGECLVYWWGVRDNPQWPGVAMEADDSGIWGYTVPANAEGLIFTNGSGKKTGNLRVPTDDKVMYVFENNYWTTYGKVEIQELYIVAGFGSLCGSDWDPSDHNNRMFDDDGDGIFTKTYENVAAGTYELKVTVGSWSKSWGDPEKGSNYILTLEQDVEELNICFDTVAEKIIITFDGQLPESPSNPQTGYTIAGTVTATGKDFSSVQVLLDGNGTHEQQTVYGKAYALANVAPGQYTLTFRSDVHVSRSYPVTVADSAVTLDAVLHEPGDANGDGKINIGDVARIYAHVRGASVLTDYALQCADYTADGSVNVGDTAKLYAFIRSENPPVTPPVNPPVEPPVQPPVSGTYVVGEDELPYTDEEIYQQLFDPNTKLEIDLDMSDKELQKLQDDYERYRKMGSKSPIYRLSNMTITVTTKDDSVSYLIKEVGARMKGNTSRTSFYNKEEGIYKYIHFKFDFQETFDDEEYYGSDCKVWSSEEERDARKDRTFATLEKLEMRWNKLYDSTYLKEAYAYEIYRSEGVLAPQCNIGVLTWSGARMGIYTVEEPVDKIFIERNVSEEDAGGDLYKLGWTNDGATFTNTGSIGAEDEDKGQFFIYDLKTNKKKSTHQDLIRMINTLNSGSVTKESFASVVDVDNFLSFAAVSYFMGNGDDLRNNYNNCYVYFLKSSGKAVFIPYDYDRCLGVNREFNPSGHSMTKDNPYGEGNQRSPLYRYSVDNGGFYTQEYTQVLLRVADNTLLTPEAFEARFNIAKALYADQVTPERNLKNAEGRDFSFDINRTGSANGGSNMSFKDYITAKMVTFRGYMGQSDPAKAECYIRGDFNGWAVDRSYAMSRSGEYLTYQLSRNNRFSFKIFNQYDNTWMGAECVETNQSVAFETDGHSNIILPSGTYSIYYDPAQKVIIINR